MWHALKRWLYLIHRWVGVATCLLFVMWFASGLVMLHVPFPDLSEDEQLDGLAPIAWGGVIHIPAADEDLREAILEMRGQRPVWHLPLPLVMHLQTPSNWSAIAPPQLVGLTCWMPARRWLRQQG